MCQNESNNMQRDLGTLVRSARKERDLSQQQLAELAGCSRLLISDIENHRANPTFSHLASIFEVLGLKLAILGSDNRPLMRLTP